MLVSGIQKPSNKINEKKLIFRIKLGIFRGMPDVPELAPTRFSQASCYTNGSLKSPTAKMFNPTGNQSQGLDGFGFPKSWLTNTLL